MSEDHKRIWLEPRAPNGDLTDRSWCKDDVWSTDPDYDGDQPTEYIRADLVLELADALRHAMGILGVAYAAILAEKTP